MTDKENKLIYKKYNILEKSYKNPFFLAAGWVMLILMALPMMIIVFPFALYDYISTDILDSDTLLGLIVPVSSMLVSVAIMAVEAIGNKRKSVYYRKLKEKYRGDIND